MAVELAEAGGIVGIAGLAIGGFVKILYTVIGVVEKNTAAFVEMKNGMEKQSGNLMENTQATRELKNSVTELKSSQDQFSRSLIDAFGKR
jgi:hypothetical protein